MASGKFLNFPRPQLFSLWNGDTKITSTYSESYEDEMSPDLLLLETQWPRWQLLATRSYLN